MSPAIKYTYGRLVLFVVAFTIMLQFPLNFFVSAMIALLISAVLSYFLLAKWRNQMAGQLASVASRRSAEKARLRAALAGDEEAAAAGDRAAAPARTPAATDETDKSDRIVDAAPAITNPEPAADQKKADQKK